MLEPIPGQPGLFWDSDDPHKVINIRDFREGDKYDQAPSPIVTWRADQHARPWYWHMHPYGSRARRRRSERVRANRIRRLDKQLRCAEWNEPPFKYVDRAHSKNGIWLCKQYGLEPVEGMNGVFYNLLADNPPEGGLYPLVSVRDYREGETLTGLMLMLVPNRWKDDTQNEPHGFLFFNEVLAERAKNTPEEIP